MRIKIIGGAFDGLIGELVGENVEISLFGRKSFVPMSHLKRKYDRFCPDFIGVEEAKEA
jgi:hypothetical protein